MLEKCLFDRVLQTLKFSPTIDLFPSRLNHQLPTYVSYKPDPNAYAVDAFSLVWKQFKFYCFPPFSCITECLQKIKKKESEGLLIVPRWPTQPFYSQLLRMLKQEPMTIQANAKNLYNPVDPQLKSQIATKTDLMACIVSGKS